MDRQKLKHYKAYLKALRLYSKSHRIKILHVDESEYGEYSHSRRRIKIDDDLSNSCEIAVFLHELGHAMDADILSLPPNSKLEVAYAKYYKNKATKAQHALVKACERRAWAYGRVIASTLKIQLGKWYDYHASYFVKTYKDRR